MMRIKAHLAQGAANEASVLIRSVLCTNEYMKP